MTHLKNWLIRGLLASVVAAPVLVPGQAQAGWGWWGWHGGWGWRPGVVVAVPPVAVGGPVVYGPPAYGYPYGAHWVPGHYGAYGYWVPGHWAY